jgi:hypothetical protein
MSIIAAAIRKVANPFMETASVAKSSPATYFWNKNSSAAKSAHDASTDAFGATDPGEPAWNTHGTHV